MNKQTKLLIVTVLGILLPQLLFAQERYFHDLTGMVDSAGVTHLTYQFSRIEHRDCAEGPDYSITYTDVQHRNTQTGEDSVLATNEARVTPNPCRDSGWRGITFFDVQAINNNPEMYVAVGAYSDGLETYGYLDFIQSGVETYHRFDAAGSYRKIFVKPHIPDTAYINTNGGSIVFGIPADISQGALDSLAHYFDYHEELPDSGITMVKDFRLFGMSPFRDRVMFGEQNNQSALYKYDLDSKAYTLSDTASFDKFDAGEVYFDSDSTHIYRTIERGDGSDSTVIMRSDAFGALGSWTALEGPTGLDQFDITVDPTTSGQLYAYSSNSMALYRSTDYAGSFEQQHTFDEPIQGVYQSPATADQYVLTRKKLYLLDEGGIVKLTEVPVAIEQPDERPTKINLSQNYPNPFNPVTNIQYAIPRATHVSLTVYDLTGRKIQVLIDEWKQPGRYDVTFNGSGLSSGMYYYRIETDRESAVRRMVLIK